jgi:hypothetical protein
MVLPKRIMQWREAHERPISASGGAARGQAGAGRRRFHSVAAADLMNDLMSGGCTGLEDALVTAVNPPRPSRPAAAVARSTSPAALATSPFASSTPAAPARTRWSWI